MNRSGINTANSETVSEMIVKPISREPSSAASSVLIPASICRLMFSMTTIASSTTKPVAMVSAISERLSRLKPHRYIAAKVPTSESGTDRLGMTVARRFRRNRNITITTNPTASVSSNWTSSIEARIVVVRSVNTVTWTEDGRPAVHCGSRVLMLSTTLMTLAPGWR